MTDLLEQSDLDGDDFKVWRLRPPMRPGEGARFLDFFLSTTRSYASRRTQSYWRLYNIYAFDGKNAP